MWLRDPGYVTVTLDTEAQARLGLATGLNNLEFYAIICGMVEHELHDLFMIEIMP